MSDQDGVEFQESISEMLIRRLLSPVPFIKQCLLGETDMMVLTPDDPDAVKAVCNRCPVHDECVTYFADHSDGIQMGIWHGIDYGNDGG